MPTYEYACKSCGEHLEVVQSFKDEPLTECPNCGGPLRKVFGSIGITFKGSGFYRTDSRSDGRGNLYAAAADLDPGRVRELARQRQQHGGERGAQPGQRQLAGERSGDGQWRRGEFYEPELRGGRDDEHQLHERQFDRRDFVECRG